MESSQTMLNPAVPDTDNTNEEIPDVEELNNGINDESKNEMNEQQENEIIHQVIQEEAPMQTLSGNEEEEPSLIPDMKTSISSGVKQNPVSSRKQSYRSVHLSQRSQQSVGRQSLPSPMPHQLQPSNDAGTNESVAWLSQRTGKEMKCKFNQTSLTWERKPLAEILHCSSKTPQISEDTEKEEIDAREAIAPVGDAEPEGGAMQESVHSMQPLEGAEAQESSSPLVKQESEHGHQPKEEASRHISLYTIMSLSPQDRKLSQGQPPNEATTEGDIRLISKKTGKEMKCSFNQTSVIWERKPLAQILHPPSAKIPSPEKDTISPETAEIKQGSVEKVSPSSPQLEEQESQDGPQLQETQESKQDGEKEAPVEALEAQAELPGAPEDMLGPPEEARAESPEALEMVQTLSLEVPEEVQAVLPEVPEEVQAVLPEAPEEVQAELPEVLEKVRAEPPEDPVDVLGPPEEERAETPEAAAALEEVPEEASES